MTRTLLGRTFLLLAALVLITTAAWLSLFRYLDAEPRARESAQLVASAVNLIRAALLAAAPDKRLELFHELSSREGMRLLPAEAEDRIRPLPDERFMNLVRQELATLLGPDTRLAAAVDDMPGFWVSFRLNDDDEEEFWLILPSDRADHAIARQWLLWALLAFMLALAAAGLIASRMSTPLKALARSARVVGSGQVPEPLPETGAIELRQLAHAFNTMAHDLKQHEEERSEVLAGISHDLRTPLTRLRLEIEMSVGSEATRQAMSSDIDQMEAVISQFMDYARGNKGEQAVPTDLGLLLSNVAERENRHQRRLAMDLPELPPVLLRPRAVERAVFNLIDNAWKYGARQVSLDLRRQDGEIRIAVGDDGPGIPESEMERLRRPFTRLDTARSNVGGTGLGLAIVERVANLHGGRLELARSPAGGLLATLVLADTGRNESAD